MKRYTILFVFILSISAYAHEGGHGPRLTDGAKQGGVLSSVIDAKEINKGSKALVVHKAELVRSEDGTVRFYLYDKSMNPLDLSKFDKTANAVLEFKKSKKWHKMPFTLTQEEDGFIGKAPKVTYKPFNIDVHVKEGDKEFFAAFDNLD